MDVLGLYKGKGLFVWVYTCYVFSFYFLPFFFGSGTTLGFGEFSVSFGCDGPG